MARKCKGHEWRYVWAETHRKCTHCPRTEWYWHCEGRWRRAIPRDLLRLSPFLNDKVYLAKDLNAQDRIKDIDGRERMFFWRGFHEAKPANVRSVFDV